MQIKEGWKQTRFEHYLISNLGQVKSKDRLTYGRYNSRRLVKGKILTPYLGLRGYYTVSINEDKFYTVPIHILVAEAFVNKPINSEVVNHKDGIKTNNVYSNLEWVTVSEDRQHAIATGLFPIRGKHVLSKRVAELDNNDNIIKVYDCVKDASKDTGIHPSSISYVCRNNNVKCKHTKLKYI